MNFLKRNLLTSQCSVNVRSFIRTRLHRSVSNKVPASSYQYDLIVVGGGIVGTASAREILCRHPNLKIAILEKEECLAKHQSGHNSGVVHAGIYYTPGTLKARLCLEGLHLSYKYFDEKKIPYKKCGKLIVATNDIENKRLDAILERGIKNKVPDLEMIECDRIKEIEPHCTGLRAIWSPHTGIVDWGLVTNQYGVDFQEMGGDIYLNFKVENFKDSGNECFPIRITGKSECFETGFVLTCAGLYSDKIAKKTGCSSNPKIVPFRGEYLILNPDKRHLINGNIYPVPDPSFPFLGVHFTPRIDGSVWLGPNAVLAFKREGYSWTDISIPELFDSVTSLGFIKLASRHVLSGMKEMAKSAFPSLQVKDLQKFIPELTVSDVSRGPSGVRAQALSADGNLVEDFVFDTGKGPIASKILHCRNAPSPAATSSLAIAKMVADKIEIDFVLK